MKGLTVLVCLSVCLLLIIQPVANAKVTPTPVITCPNKINGPTVTYTVTYGPPGPDGSIYVESSPPGAVISVNGDNYGHAPVTIPNLWPGSYTVTAELAGYQKFTSVTTISGATRASIYCSLAPENSGTGLYVMSNPAGANVYLDGESKGKTPLMIRGTAAGSHAIRMTLSGYADWESAVDAPTGGTRTVSATLKETGTDLNQGLSITSNPAGATIHLDGLEKGKTPKILNNLAPGIHILAMEYPGYTSWKSTIDVPETKIKVISVNLTPNPESAPGWITVFSNPANASVTLDGIYVGRTSAGSSLNLDTKPPGDYALVLALPGYKPYSTRVTVLPNNVSTVNVTLLPVSGPFAKGALSVTSDPAGATILMDNESIGTTPFTADDITAGNHQVTLRMKGYQDYSTSVLVSGGSIRTVSATLVPGTPSLHTPVFPLTALGALGIAGFFILRKFH
jgi:hypothetical protein